MNRARFDCFGGLTHYIVGGCWEWQAGGLASAQLHVARYAAVLVSVCLNLAR